MKIAFASIILALGANCAGAQIVPLGAPIIPTPKTSGPPSAGSQSTGRLKPSAPLGSNYSPYSLQPQSTVNAGVRTAMPEGKPVALGLVNDPNAPSSSVDRGQVQAKPKANHPLSDMQRLAPKGAERTEMPTADAPAPR